MKKTIFTLNVDNYAPEITKITYPLIKAYAKKIGAEFYEIKERKSPNMPPVYEKLQIYDLGREMGNDWNIYIDADTLVHPETVDFTQFISKDTVIHNGCDMANVRWKYDKYFERDGRNIGSCNWFAIASNLCLDLWHPLKDLTFEEALENINPIPNELNNGINKEHLIDDYLLSRNIAKYGLKFDTVIGILPRIRLENSSFFWHEYTIPIYEKVRKMKDVIRTWQLDGNKDMYFQPSPQIQGWMTDNELQWLYDNVKEMNSVVEIGSWKGRSTHALASGCKGQVYAIDHFKGSLDEMETTHKEASVVDISKEFEQNMKGFSNVITYKEDSLEAVKHFKPKSIDMVFIDGGHSDEQFEADLKAWKPIAKKLLCGHGFGLVGGILKKMNKRVAIEKDSIWSIEI